MKMMHSPTPTLRQWSTFSSLFALGSISTLVLSTVLRGSVVHVAEVLGITVPFVVVWFGAYFLRERVPCIASSVRFFLPLVLYGAVYSSIHQMVTTAHSVIVDAALLNADQWLFGTNPITWLGAHGTPFLTDFLYLSYFSYYFWMPLLLILMWKRNDERDFRVVLSAMILGWYGALVTYALFPALGPQRFIPGELPHLTGWLPTTQWIQFFYSSGLKPWVRDCVPSMHTGITLLTLTFAFRFQRTFFWIYLLPALGTILGTMYLQQHYVIDVLLGIVAYGCIYTLVMRMKPQ